MNFELGQYNIEKVKKALCDVIGKSVMVNNTSLFSVTSIDIDESVMYDADPCPEEGYDGGKRDLITLTFNFEKGKAAHSFCPDEEHCEIIFETEDLWIIRIEDMKKFLEREKEHLEFRIKDYEDYMNR